MIPKSIDDLSSPLQFHDPSSSVPIKKILDDESILVLIVCESYLLYRSIKGKTTMKE